MRTNENKFNSQIEVLKKEKQTAESLLVSKEK